MTDIVAVATSGGRDSIALLHATLSAAVPLGLGVLALHVHHGLQPEADQWLADLQVRCAQWASTGWPLALEVTRLQTRPASGESVEAWARRERYAALGRMARDAGARLVLLAHHRSDQAETVLLQALRGAGPAGLGAMPRLADREGTTFARPWLDQPSDRIDAYVEMHGLAFVRDPSNEDPGLARGRLRAKVMPALREAFPDAEQALAAVARRAHEARCVLDEVAREELASLGAADGAPLPLAPWRSLSSARRAHVLRAWLGAGSPGGVAETLVQRLLEETGDDSPRRWPMGDGIEVRSWRGELKVEAGLSVVAEGSHTSLGMEVVGPPETALKLLRCGFHGVAGWEGRLEVFAVPECGVAPTRLAHAVARARAGGEQFRLQPRAAARSLKKQFQAAGIGPAQRAGPLVFDAQGALLYVPGLGVDAGAWCTPGAPQWALRWHPGVAGAEASV